jgi:drug/metabolite transporter (DMT)-like permease
VAKLLLTAAGVTASELVSTRTALASLCLVATLAALRPALLRVDAREAGRVAVLGIVGMALSNYTYYLTLTLIPVATAVLLIYTAPLLVLAAGVAIFGERLRPRDVVAATITLAGAALVVRAYAPAALRVNAAGLALGVFNAVAFAFYSLWAKTMPPGLSPWTVLAYSLASAALVWLPFAPPWTLLFEAHPPLVWVGIGVVVLFGTLLPFALYLAGLARISAAHAAVTSTVEPVVAAIVAYLVLDERLAWPQLAGGALVLAGIALLHVRPRAPLSTASPRIVGER